MKSLFQPALAVFLAFASACLPPNCHAAQDGLRVEAQAGGKSFLSYRGAPLFAFGPGDEMRILGGGADVDRWAKWQRDNGMNLIRAYPMSVPLSAYGAEGPAPFRQRDGKWDVDDFNGAYFRHLGDVAKALEKNGIILHLQLWQIVFFKGGDRRWDINYLNPANNVNDWTRGFSRGRDYIDAPAGSAAADHQRRWVLHILDAMKGRGNVIIDVINELGNEMGTMEWAAGVAGWIHDWEKDNDWKFIVGVDSEHHYTPERFGPHRDRFDIIILNELRSPEHAMAAVAAFNMPAVSVRSSDQGNQYEDYMFARADQTGPEHQTRYRTLCYRSIFSGLQSVGAYWKSTVDEADYLDMGEWPGYARALRAFWVMLAPHWPLLEPGGAGACLSGAVTPHAHALVSPALLAVYLECGPKTWNNSYPASSLRVRCGFNRFEALHFDPRTGLTTPVVAERDGDALVLPLPPFTDDAAVIIRNLDAPAP